MKKISLALILTLLLAPLCFGVEQNEDTKLYKKELGIVEIPLSRSKTKGSLDAALSLRIKSEKRCTFSDFDAIALDAVYHKQPNIIISLEPLIAASKSFKPISKKLSKVKTITTKGLDINLEFAFVKRTQALGIYICSDTLREGRCNTENKDIADYGKIFRFYSSPPKKGYLPPDRIYFFRPILVSEKKALFPSRQMSPKRYRLQKEFFENELGFVIPGQAHGRAEKLSRMLTSMPLRNLVGRIAIDLPVYNASRCVWPEDK